eukprot:3131881-Pyramimonas_sp.AAC.1
MPPRVQDGRKSPKQTAPKAPKTPQGSSKRPPKRADANTIDVLMCLTYFNALAGSSFRRSKMAQAASKIVPRRPNRRPPRAPPDGPR